MAIHELGHVVLYVSSLERSTRFYRDTLGFPQIGELPGASAFSGGRTHHELLLIEVGGEPGRASQPKPGLYHVGFKVGDTPAELIEVAEKLKRAHVALIGATDHTITHSLYIRDPDQNELELYIDVSEDWRNDPQKILTRAKPLPYIANLFH